MGQHRIGTVIVRNGSNVVQGIGTAWLSTVDIDGNPLVKIGHAFNIHGEDVVYSVAAVVTDTELRLAVNYEGTDKDNVEYQVTWSFTPILGLYEPDLNDLDWPILMKHLFCRKIDGFVFGQPPSINNYWVYGNGETVLFGNSEIILYPGV